MPVTVALLAACGIALIVLYIPEQIVYHRSGSLLGIDDDVEVSEAAPRRR